MRAFPFLRQAMECDRTRMMEKRPDNIFLIGFMGAGKSTIASRMSRRYGMKLIEMDRRIEEEEGTSISRIFEEKGEECFRDLETALLQRLSGGSGQIVSCGGGAVLRPENIRLMKENGRIVLLTASPETILARVKRSSARPLLEGRKNIAAITELMEKRMAAYEAAADMIVGTDGKSPEQICREILSGLSEQPLT